MLMGTAEPFLEPEQQFKFVEDLTPEEKARMYMEKEGIPLPAGLVNLGNTCYMNSAIQNLRRIPELRQELTNYVLTNSNDL